MRLARASDASGEASHCGAHASSEDVRAMAASCMPSLRFSEAADRWLESSVPPAWLSRGRRLIAAAVATVESVVLGGGMRAVEGL